MTDADTLTSTLNTAPDDAQHPEPDRISDANDPVEKPYMTIVPTSGWAALHLKETWQFRDLLFTLAGRDLKVRYKQTVLGVAWVVLQPLIGAGIFSFVFGIVAKLPSDGRPYFAFSYAGLLGWNLFNNTLSKANGCLLGNGHLISKVYFPRLILPLSTIPSTLVDFGVALAMMALLLLFYHIPIHWSLLLLPVWMLVLMMLAMGVGLCTAALSVSYRDVNYILPVFMQFLMYASPVAYSIEKIPAKLQAIYMLNPLVAPLIMFRGSLLGFDAIPPWLSAVYAAILAASIFAIGTFSFKRMERKFADVI